MPHLHISLNVFRDLGGAGEGWGQKSLLTLWHGKSCHTLGFKTSCWFVEMQTLLSVPASVSPLSWSLASQWNVSPHSNYFIFFTCSFFGLELSPRTAFSSPRHRCCYPQTDRGKAALLIKSYLIKSCSNVTSPWNLIPISLLTLELWHFDTNQHKRYSRIALMTLWALPM